MREPLKQLLRLGRVLISDGGIGTELQKRGLEPGACGESWNLLRPDVVSQIHRAYVAAGSEIITTNSFNGNAFALGRWDLCGHVYEYALAAARLARAAAGEGRYVMGSVGPCGGFLAPLGDISVAALEASLRAQVRGLLDGGVDAINFETCTALEELGVCLRIAAELNAPCVIASLAYEKVRGGFRTMMGISPEQAARFAADNGAYVVGANCGASIPLEEFALLIREYRRATALPLLAQPNGGTPHIEEDRIVYPTSAEDWASALAEIARAAQIVGGCCGCAPEHIAAFAARLRSHAAGI